MPIFRISGKKLQKVSPSKPSGSDKEKQLQKLIENNLDTIFEMILIASEFSTSHGGRIDTLAMDKDKRPVIIEYKFDKSSTILLQGLYYMDWLVENKAEFEKIVKIKLKQEVPLNWKSGVRLILIAKSFEIWDKFAVNRIKEEVELYEYTLYENNELNLEKITLPKDFRGSGKISITSIKEFSVEDQMNKIEDHKIKQIVAELRERIRLISDEIVERATRDLIVFKSTVNFAQVYPQKNQYWFDVRLPKGEVKKKYISLDVRPHKDEVFTHIRCSQKTRIGDLVALAEEAYENTR
jgi:predicted transport protein